MSSIEFTKECPNNISEKRPWPRRPLTETFMNAMSMWKNVTCAKKLSISLYHCHLLGECMVYWSGTPYQNKVKVNIGKVNLFPPWKRSLFTYTCQCNKMLHVLFGILVWTNIIECYIKLKFELHLPFQKTLLCTPPPYVSQFLTDFFLFCISD